MLTVKIPDFELFDEVNNTFVFVHGCELQLEHSLLSVARWESRWKKPFLVDTPKDREEYIDYIRCMTINRNVNDAIYSNIPPEIIAIIENYIQESQTATWFKDNKNSGRSREVVTSELIYFWMFSNGIPIECEKWHLSRLMTLIRVFLVKTGPQQKMTKLNAERKAKYKTKG